MKEVLTGLQQTVPSLLKKEHFPFFTNWFPKSAMIREHILARKARGKHFKKREKKGFSLKEIVNVKIFDSSRTNFCVLSLICSVPGQCEIQLDRNLSQLVN